MASDYCGVVAARLPIRFPPCVRLELLQTYSTATSRLDPGLFLPLLLMHCFKRQQSWESDLKCGFFGNRRVCFHKRFCGCVATRQAAGDRVWSFSRRRRDRGKYLSFGCKVFEVIKSSLNFLVKNLATSEKFVFNFL